MEPSATAFTQPDAAPGQRILSRFVLRRILGRGGMGIVWLAHDETLAEDIALKLLPAHVRWDSGGFEMLKRETRRARQLSHTGIVRIHDFFEDETTAGIAMEFVDGASLAALLAANPTRCFSVEEILAWLPQLCTALDYAHREAKVVHRDLKPANILLTPGGVPKIADFGVARSLHDASSRVSRWTPGGTILYMSPQQLMGEPASAGDDLYALGATLYELLAGQPPFHTGDVARQIETKPPDAIAARRAILGIEAPPVSAVWTKAINACLAKDPLDRPASAGELLARLAPDRSAGILAGHFQSSAGWKPALLSSVRRTWSARATLGVTAVIALVATATWRFWPQPAAPPPVPATADTLLLHLPFDGEARDISVHHLPIRIAKLIPTPDRFGREDAAYHFNGLSQCEIDLSPALAPSATRPMTVAVWFRVTDAEKGHPLIVGRSGEGGAFYFSLDFEQRRVRFSCGPSGHESAVTLDTPPITGAGKWHHAAATFDGRELNIFVDGRRAAHALYTGQAALLPTRAPLRIGYANNLAPNGFDGDLDEARLYARALNATELTALYLRESTPPEQRPRFVRTTGSYSDRADLAAAAMGEFGPAATLADWDEIKRWHADDPADFAASLDWQVDTGVLVQRAGKRYFEKPRHYSTGFYNGNKPPSYLAHDNLGAHVLCLGSWWDQAAPLLVRLPDALPGSAAIDETVVLRKGQILSPWRVVVTGTPHGDEIADGRLWARPPDGRTALERDLKLDAATTSLAFRFRVNLPKSPWPLGHHAELVTAHGRTLVAACELAGTNGQAFRITLGDAAQPAVRRELGASYGEFDCVLLVRDGELRFRAVSVASGLALFDERAAPADLRLAGIERVALKLESAQSREVWAERIALHEERNPRASK